MNKIIIIILFFGYINLALSENSFIYTIEDLHVLKSEKNYPEYIKHALDIRPSQRNKEWQEMTVTMANGLLQEMISQNKYTEKGYQLMLSLQLWPLLKKDEVFISYRNSYSEKFLTHCFSNNNQCEKKLEFIWDSTPLRNRFPDFGVNLAILINKFNPKYKIINLIKESLISSTSEFYCQKNPIKTAIYQEVSNFLQVQQTNIQLKIFIDDLLSRGCRDIFLKDLKQLLSVRSLQTRQLAYQVLKSQDRISQAENDLYLTLYILRGPAIGDTFNLAWANTLKLGQSYSRRSKMLNNLNKIDPLPDELFAMPNLKKTKILLKLIQNNIPEYINHYATTCINFLTGATPFPNGNPAVSCQEFFKNYKEISNLDPSLIEKYEQIRQL
ncbi:MAG: hypothetical protein HOJ35_05025 [Bdellovibrionales bacterium]|jgi:hypothetical protein|nr:hypothetical protein [Bdellovibrionales bacterium]